MNNSLRMGAYIDDGYVGDVERAERGEQASGIGAMYIEMLCDKFRHRGISNRVKADAEKQEKSQAEIRSFAPQAYGVIKGKVSPYDRKYRTGVHNGALYMSSDDFANYYKDSRNYKMPRASSRREAEYEAAEAEARAKAEAGIPSKKAIWLAIMKELAQKVKRVPSKLNAKGLKEFSSEWFPADKEENRVEGKKTRIPSGVIPVIAVVTLSLLMIVSSSVMVSRAESRVSSLENEISELKEKRDELATNLELKNNMLEIREIAVNEYGMVSRDFVNSEYLELRKEEGIEVHEKQKKKSVIAAILDAIGLGSEE